jgi:hypothetical protein
MAAAQRRVRFKYSSSLPHIQTVDVADVEHHGPEFLLDFAAQEIGPAAA